MSVKMALAKLCACTCGGAIIGGGAVHVSANPNPRPAIVKKVKSKVRHREAYKPHRVKRAPYAKTECEVIPGTTTTTRTVTYAPPLPPPPPYAGGSGGAVVIGGSGGFGGGFGGGFFSG